MVNLQIDNSVSKITGLTILQIKEIRNLLSYKISKAEMYFGGYPNPVRFLIDKYGNFPTGLLYLVNSYLNLKEIEVIETDLRTRPNSSPDMFTLSNVPSPRPDQINAATAAISSNRGIISMPTGTGKTLVAALIVNMLQVRTLIVVPTLELKRQLSESFTEWFGSLENLTIENVDALDPKKVVTDVDCVIIDEFHRSGAKTYRELNKIAWSKIYYRFGITATPFRNQDNERLLLESILSEVIYRLTYKDAVDRQYIVPIHAFYIELPKLKVTSDTWPQVYSELVVNNKHRNETIAKLLLYLKRIGGSTLCLVKEINHGTNIIEECVEKFPFIKGENENNKELLTNFNNRKALITIGTTGVLGEGIDTRPAQYIIIAGLGKSRGQFMQNCGRGTRFHKDSHKESCKIVIFKDKSHRWTLNHFNEQVKFLKEEYGCTPMKLEL